MASILLASTSNSAKVVASTSSTPSSASSPAVRQLVVPKGTSAHSIFKRYLQCDFSDRESPTYILSTLDAQQGVFHQTPLKDCSYDDCIDFIQQARYSYPGLGPMSDKIEVYSNHAEQCFLTKKEQKQLQEDRAFLGERAVWERLDELNMQDSPDLNGSTEPLANRAGAFSAPNPQRAQEKDAGVRGTTDNPLRHGGNPARAVLGASAKTPITVRDTPPRRGTGASAFDPLTFKDTPPQAEEQSPSNTETDNSLSSLSPRRLTEDFTTDSEETPGTSLRERGRRYVLFEETVNQEETHNAVRPIAQAYHDDSGLTTAPSGAARATSSKRTTEVKSEDGQGEPSSKKARPFYEATGGAAPGATTNTHTHEKTHRTPEDAARERASKGKEKMDDTDSDVTPVPVWKEGVPKGSPRSATELKKLEIDCVDCCKGHLTIVKRDQGKGLGCSNNKKTYHGVTKRWRYDIDGCQTRVGPATAELLSYLGSYGGFNLSSVTPDLVADMFTISPLDCVDCKEGTLTRIEEEEGSAFTVKCNNFTMTFDQSSRKAVYNGCATTLGVRSGYLLWTLENEPELLLEEAN